MEQLSDYILSGNFEKPLRMLDGLTINQLEGTLVKLAFESKSVAVYSFVVSLLINNRSAELNYIASIIIGQALCHLEGAYQSAYYHAKEAARINPSDVTYKEYLLFFHIIPDRLLSKEDAIQIAENIIISKPESQAALDILKRYNQK